MGESRILVMSAGTVRCWVRPFHVSSNQSQLAGESLVAGFQAPFDACLRRDGGRLAISFKVNCVG